MTDVIHYLNQYLKHHKSVNIGKLGHFSTEPMGAMIHPIIHEFKPPHFLLLFEENISAETSAEFTQFISHHTNIPIEEAIKHVEAFSKEVHDGLKAENLFVIAEFGIFKRLPDHTIAFEADENLQLNPDVFGLPAFTLDQKSTSEADPFPHPQQEISEVENSQENEVIVTTEDPIFSEQTFDQTPDTALQNDFAPVSTEKEAAEIITNQAANEEPTEHKPKKKRAWLVWVLLLLILAGGLTGLYITGYLKILYDKSISLTKVSDKTEEQVSEKTNKEETNYTEQNEELPVQDEVEVEPDVTEQIQSEEIVTPKQSKKIRYFVVADCYTYKELAEQRVKSLQSQGYQSEIAGQTKQGHFIVSYGEYSDKTLADRQLQDIRKNVNKHAWLYIR